MMLTPLMLIAAASETARRHARYAERDDAELMPRR